MAAICLVVQVLFNIVDKMNTVTFLPRKLSMISLALLGDTFKYSASRSLPVEWMQI